MRFFLITVCFSLFLKCAIAQIDTACFTKCSWMDLSSAGTIDWAVFGYGRQNRDVQVSATDYKKGGQGIIKELGIKGNVLLKNDTGYERMVWNDGTVNKAGGVIDPAGIGVFGIIAALSDESKLILRFKPPADSKTIKVSVFFWSSGAGIAHIKSGRSVTDVRFPATAGAIQVAFHGKDLLEVELSPQHGTNLQLKSLAATVSENKLWWIRDNRLAMLYAPLRLSEILKSGYSLKNIDYLKMATDYADIMIKYGRDRYGKVHSPLFSNILTRERHPQSTPYPLFAPASQTVSNSGALSLPDSIVPAGNPYHKFNYNVILNYPQGLGKEGPHKITLFGSDPIEDKALYDLLFQLSSITGNPKYETAASQAINYWFKHTQSSTGLYPWGEHMGWDLFNDCPLYFKGPSQFFFEANYHEVRDFVPFLKLLTAIKPAPGDTISPLDKYATGIWKAHFWNKEKAYYNRHGDYNGMVSQQGELGAFPAHLAFYLRVWCAAYLHSENIRFKSELAGYFRAVLKMALERCEKYGFYPFDLSVDLKGKDPGKEIPLQSVRLAHHCVWLAKQLEQQLPDVAENLRVLARYHLGNQAEEETFKNLAWAEQLDDIDFIQGLRKAGNIPRPGNIKDFSNEVQSEEFAKEILLNVLYAKQTGNNEYLRLAEHYARIAAKVFFDEKSPLPTAFANGIRSRTLKGLDFPDFYFNGSKLMRAFVCLGQALKEKK